MALGGPSAFSIAGGDGIGTAVIKSFTTNPQLKAAFATAYGAGAEDSSNVPAQRNQAHTALVETIVSNRSSFPAAGFSIHTDLGDGTSVTTAIPPANGSATVRTGNAMPSTARIEPSVAAPPSPERLEAQSLVMSVVVGVANLSAIDGQSEPPPLAEVSVAATRFGID